jgi:hypothetical protein
VVIGASVGAVASSFSDRPLLGGTIFDMKRPAAGPAVPAAAASASGGGVCGAPLTAIDNPEKSRDVR